MRALYLLRHGLNEANEARLYCGSTDLPLSPRGREMALALRESRPLPACELYVTSGMRRAEETLSLLTGRGSDLVLTDLRELDFGRFELHGYDELKSDPDYLRWIGDGTGRVRCPGGECAHDFGVRVRRGGDALLALPWGSALVVCHGGTIARLMEAWFPAEGKTFHEWQPAACRGWRVTFEDRTPVGFEEI